MPNPEKALKAEKELVALIDKAFATTKRLLTSQGDVLNVIDRLVFDYYGLDDSDVAIVEETVHSIIPDMQHRRRAGLQRILTQADSAPQLGFALLIVVTILPTLQLPL